MSNLGERSPETEPEPHSGPPAALGPWPPHQGPPGILLLRYYCPCSLGAPAQASGSNACQNRGPGLAPTFQGQGPGLWTGSGTVRTSQPHQRLTPMGESLHPAPWWALSVTHPRKVEGPGKIISNVIGRHEFMTSSACPSPLDFTACEMGPVEYPSLTSLLAPVGGDRGTGGAPGPASGGSGHHRSPSSPGGHWAQGPGRLVHWEGGICGRAW